MKQIQVEREWRFDALDVLREWRTNQDVVEIRVEDGAMRFRTQGYDPILEFVPLLDIPTVPQQSVEIGMKCSRDGVAELFWSNTTESPYGGFMPEKRTEFRVVGDNQWRTYRIFPFWQHEGRIVRFRFDPPQYADVSLQYIRIVRLNVPVASGQQRQFLFRNGAEGWTAWHGVSMQSTAGGLRLRMTEPDGFAGVLVNLPADDLSVLALRLRSNSSREGAIVFAARSAYGLKAHSFDVPADGKTHLLNLDMLESPDWKGEVVMLGIRPGARVGDEIVLESLQVSDRAIGPADLRVLFFGVEDALPRAGVPVQVVLRVMNMGGETARRLNARLLLPSGARIVNKSKQPGQEVSFSHEAEWRWQVVFPKAYRGELSVHITGNNIAPQRATVQAVITPRLSSRQLKEVPAPQVVKPAYGVGVYYFPGWRTSSQWYPITRFPERKPVLGWYLEGDRQIADWHIRWAVEHGITFFVYDWYWVQGARQLEHALHEGYLQSPFRKYLQFCLLWANHNPPNTSSLEDCVAVTRHWIEQYFFRPEHLTIDGKPAVIIFSPYRLRADLGADGVKRALDAMRNECVKAGLKGLYILACVGSTGEAVVCAREGYDAITAYNWPHLGMPPGVQQAPFDTLVDAYREQWQSIVKECPIPMLVPVSGGWDSRPWHGKSALVRTGRNPQNFKRHLQDARRFVEANPRKTLPMVLIEAWNEWGEGSYIEPHREFVFGYLDAIREVFTSAPARHVDLTPADVGMTPPQVPVLSPSTTRWDFSQGTLGWEVGMYITDPRIEYGALTVQTTGNDPALFGPPIQIDAGRYRRIRIRLRLTPDDGAFEESAQIFWSTRTLAESEATSVRFPVRVDGQWHEHVVNVGENPRWRGVVTRLRFDPCNRAGVKVQVSAIELLP